jgi:putative nucleotidyltransferase with HDIG domain
MPMTRLSSGHAPRLAVWITGVSFTVIGGVLGLTFLVLSWQTQSRLRHAVAEDLEGSQQRFADVEARRTRERRLQAVALAENPTLKAAVDTYVSEVRQGTPSGDLLPTIRHEVVKLADLMGVPALALVETGTGTVLASAGRRASDWPAGARVSWTEPDQGGDELVISRGQSLFLATTVPLQLGPDTVGTVVLATPLDDAYASSLATGARADVLIFHEGQVVASSGSDLLGSDIASVTLPAAGPVIVNGQELVVRRLSQLGSTGVYAVSSVASAATATTSEVTRVMFFVGALALLLAGAASLWLARTLARPIDELTESLARMAETKDLDGPLPRSGISREMDALADSFDTLRSAVSQAEAESDAAYLGVIGALAAALDARDPYTAGHSNRVADLSVLLAKEMDLPAQDRETLRLGALLHDIGKIGINDSVLRKPGKLTPEEFDHIKLHPVLGARILQPLTFLTPHLPVVELHHERPDGRGYPHGLRGDDIPLFARIVHVADAFDAMTSARAYRPARPAAEAMAELWRNVGTDFDPRVVQAMAAVWDTKLVQHAGEAASVAAPFRDPIGATLPFRLRAARVPQTVG